MNALISSRTERRANYLWFYSVPVDALGSAAELPVTLGICLQVFETALAVFLETECASCHSQSFDAHCRLQRVFRFADNMVAGLRLAEASSYALRFELALFTAEDEDGRSKPLATAELVHVLKAADGGKPQLIGADIKARLRPFTSPTSA